MNIDVGITHPHILDSNLVIINIGDYVKIPGQYGTEYYRLCFQKFNDSFSLCFQSVNSSHRDWNVLNCAKACTKVTVEEVTKALSPKVTSSDLKRLTGNSDYIAYGYKISEFDGQKHVFHNDVHIFCATGFEYREINKRINDHFKKWVMELFETETQKRKSVFVFERYWGNTMVGEVEVRHHKSIEDAKKHLKNTYISENQFYYKETRYE